MLTPDQLRPLEIFEDLPDEVLAWFAGRSRGIELESGAHLFERGQPADYLFVVVDGTIQRYEEIAGQWLVVATTGRGEVTGMLPFSRMTHYPGTTVAAEPARVLRLEKVHFPEMLAVSYEIGRRLVSSMADRVRGDVRLEQQRDRLMALGKLSAGLAHELNNPIAAVRRTAESLLRTIEAQDAAIRRLLRRIDDGAVATVVQKLRRELRDRRPGEGGALEASEREDALGDWLEAKGVDDPWSLATQLAAAGATVGDLESAARSIPGEVLGDALVWLGCGLAASGMSAEIGSAATRVSELVASIKTFSQMDRSVEHKSIDLEVGLESTLAIFAHAIHRGGIRVERRFAEALPRVRGNAGELNQVWSHLIDNAIDAMGEGGSLRVETGADEWNVEVRIVDDGHGIPEEIRSSIFEPFFTTRDVGEGTGLGLDIALRIVRLHEGQIRVESRPGCTEMTVCLPIAHDPGSLPSGPDGGAD